MTRVRISTTVDRDLLGAAAGLHAWRNQSELIEAALEALLASRRNAEIDAKYRAYDVHPPKEPDEWGDLESFSEAVARS